MNIKTLVDERDIYRQLIHFARAMDNRDWQAIRNITSENLISDFGMGIIEGNEKTIEFIRSFLDNCGTTQHILGNIIIDIDGDVATSQSYVSDMHLSSDEHSEKQFRTLGNYSDTWSKLNGVWIMIERIKDNRATIGSFEVFNK